MYFSQHLPHELRSYVIVRIAGLVGKTLGSLTSLEMDYLHRWLHAAAKHLDNLDTSSRDEWSIVSEWMQYELRTMSYKEYLETRHWLLMRQDTLARANHRCSICNVDSKLQVHHRTYERRGQEQSSDLIVLCDECHAKFHDKLPIK